MKLARMGYSAGPGERVKLCPFGLKLLQKSHLALHGFFVSVFVFANNMQLFSHYSPPDDSLP